jgi:hypothetical protein
MRDCAITGMRFETPTNLALEATFDGGKLTSPTAGLPGSRRWIKSWACASP